MLSYPICILVIKNIIMQNNAVTWFLYIIRTSNQSLYTGITTDVSRRLQQHQNGRGAKYLKGHKDIYVVYQIKVGDRSTALKLEYRIKQLSKLKKEQLVANSPDLTNLLTLLNQ